MAQAEKTRHLWTGLSRVCMEEGESMLFLFRFLFVTSLINNAKYAVQVLDIGGPLSVGRVFCPPFFCPSAPGIV